MEPGQQVEGYDKANRIVGKRVSGALASERGPEEIANRDNIKGQQRQPKIIRPCPMALIQPEQLSIQPFAFAQRFCLPTDLIALNYDKLRCACHAIGAQLGFRRQGLG